MVRSTDRLLSETWAGRHEKRSDLILESRKAIALHPKFWAKSKRREVFYVNPSMENGLYFIQGGKSAWS